MRPLDEWLAALQEELAHLAARDADDLAAAGGEGFFEKGWLNVSAGGGGSSFRRALLLLVVLDWWVGDLRAGMGIQRCETAAPGFAADVPELLEVGRPEDVLDGVEAFGGEAQAVALRAEGDGAVLLVDYEGDGGAEEGLG